MSIFPEHLHVEGEDDQLHRAERDHQYSVLLEGYVGFLILAAVVFAACVIALVLV